jgi:hypothetical protein
VWLQESQDGHVWSVVNESTDLTTLFEREEVTELTNAATAVEFGMKQACDNIGANNFSMPNIDKFASLARVAFS